MGSKRQNPSSNGSLSKSHNKLRRQELFVKQKKEKESQRRDERFRRKREEDKNPELKSQRLARNVPVTIDSKRVWDEVDSEGLGASVDVGVLKRRKLEQAEAEAAAAEADAQLEEENEDDDEDDKDSMLDPSDEDDEDGDQDSEDDEKPNRRHRAPSNAPSLAPSLAPSTTSTQLDLTPDSLALQFPTLFNSEPPPMPKILITTSLNSTLHAEAELLTSLFPNSVYIRRTQHRYAHKYSLREICRFASARNFTAVLVLKEDAKRPTGLSIVHLPSGPTLTFSISNWLPGSKIPGHGNATQSWPELNLQGYNTTVGLLTARVFQTLFPPQPEFEGRQVVTMHNHRDYVSSLRIGARPIE